MVVLRGLLTLVDTLIYLHTHAHSLTQTNKYTSTNMATQMECSYIYSPKYAHINQILIDSYLSTLLFTHVWYLCSHFHIQLQTQTPFKIHLNTDTYNHNLFTYLVTDAYQHIKCKTWLPFIHICVFKHTSELMNLLKHKIVINMHIVTNDNMLTIHSLKRV